MDATYTAYWLIASLLLILLGDHHMGAVQYEECAKVDLGVYVASQSNCSKYIYCAGPGSFEAECLADHYYDEKQDRCVERKLVTRCQAKEQIEPTRTPTVMAEQKPLSITLKALPKASPCFSYMVCYEGAGISKVCTPARLVSCGQSDAVAPARVCRRGVYDFIPHPSNCAYFYYCSNGQKIIHRCPRTYTWHYERRSCVQRAQQKCFTARDRPRRKLQAEGSTS